MPVGVKVKVWLPFENSVVPATRPLCAPHTRKLDEVIDAVDNGVSKLITMLALRAILFVLPTGAVELTAIACAAIGAPRNAQRKSAAQTFELVININPLHAIFRSQAPDYETVLLNETSLENSQHAQGREPVPNFPKAPR